MALLWILINVMCTVNIRGHEANFYEAEARCHEAEIEDEARKSEAEAEAEAEWFGLEATWRDRPCIFEERIFVLPSEESGVIGFIKQQ